jgi:hypothetical protein
VGPAMTKECPEHLKIEGGKFSVLLRQANFGIGCQAWRRVVSIIFFGKALPMHLRREASEFEDYKCNIT